MDYLIKIRQIEKIYYFVSRELSHRARQVIIIELSENYYKSAAKGGKSNLVSIVRRGVCLCHFQHFDLAVDGSDESFAKNHLSKRFPISNINFYLDILFSTVK